MLLLSIYGALAVFSAGGPYALFRYGDEQYFIKRQVIWVAVGIVIMILSSRIRTEIIGYLAPYAYGFSLVLLGLTLIFGMVGNGAQRWISLGPITIQPSEIAKLTMILMLARYFSDNEKRATAQRGKDSFLYGTAFPALIMLAPILMVMLQKHLSCIIILGTIGLLLIIMVGVRLKYIGIFTALGAAGVSYIALFTDYTKDRITVWQNPEKYKLTGGWQTLQGLMAIGSGGLFGKGYGNGELKHCYVSEPANDMIFAIVCEELGIIGALVAFLLFAILAVRGFQIGLNAKGSFESLVALGISTKLATQFLLNIAVITNTIPNTGISLPFFSYGGSSLIMLFFEMGIMLAISKKSMIRK